MELMRSPATTSWTWRPPPMLASALTSRSMPLWRSACSTRSRPPCRSPGPRSRRRDGRHRSLPVLQRLRCRSPAPVPSTDRLITRPDPAVLGLRVAVGDPALDELAGETAVPAFQQPPDCSPQPSTTTRAANPNSGRRHRLDFVLLSGSVRPGRLDAREAASAGHGVSMIGVERYEAAAGWTGGRTPRRCSTAGSPSPSIAGVEVAAETSKREPIALTERDMPSPVCEQQRPVSDQR